MQPGVKPAVTHLFLLPRTHTDEDLVVSKTPEHLASLLINHAEMKGCLEAEDECRKH